MQRPQLPDPRKILSPCSVCSANFRSPVISRAYTRPAISPKQRTGASFSGLLFIVQAVEFFENPVCNFVGNPEEPAHKKVGDCNTKPEVSQERQVIVEKRAYKQAKSVHVIPSLPWIRTRVEYKVLAYDVKK